MTTKKKRVNMASKLKSIRVNEDVYTAIQEACDAWNLSHGEVVELLIQQIAKANMIVADAERQLLNNIPMNTIEM